LETFGSVDCPESDDKVGRKFARHDISLKPISAKYVNTDHAHGFSRDTAVLDGSCKPIKICCNCGAVITCSDDCDRACQVAHRPHGFFELTWIFRYECTCDIADRLGTSKSRCKGTLRTPPK